MNELKTKRIIDENDSVKHKMAENDNGDMFLISEFFNREAVNYYMPSIAAITPKNTPGFVKWFSENSALYVIFTYEEGTNLLRFLEKERITFEDRLFIAKSVMLNARELESAPALVQKTAVSAKNIVIQDGNIRFNRIMDYPLEYLELNNEHIFALANRLLRDIFTYKQISRNPELKIICEKCEKGLYTSFGEVLRDFDMLQKEEEKQQNLKDVLLKKNQSKIKALGKALTLTLIVLSAVFVFYQYIIGSKEGVPTYSPVYEIGGVSVWELPYAGENGGTNKETIFVFGKETVEIPETPSAIEATEPAEPEPAEAEPAPPESVTHLVVRGDTISRLCLKYYGSMDNVMKIAELNGVNNPNLIFPGQVIIFPYYEN